MTNPLDRIRGLKPADMTDDELGVAVWDARHGATVVANFDFNNPKVSIESGGRRIGSVWKHDGTVCCVRSSNPALSYDALLPIVREWCGDDPAIRRRRIRLWTDTLDNLMGDHDFALCCELTPFATPRQLAEAFVTAAREVGDE